MTRTASVALRNPANWNRAVPLSYEQFRYSFANVVGEDEAKELDLGYSVPGAGEPLFQVVSANLNPWSEAKVNSMNPERGPMVHGRLPGGPLKCFTVSARNLTSGRVRRR